MSESVVKWVPGMVPPRWGYYLVTTENAAAVRGVMEAWWRADNKRWEHDEFTLPELGLMVVAYAELPEPWSGETE